MKELRCGVCGSINMGEIPVDIFKLPELDLGGQPKLNGVVAYETMVHSCTCCGYRNFDIRENILSSKDILKEDGYKYILNSDMETTAKDFVALAYLYEVERKYSTSAKAYSYASYLLSQSGDKDMGVMFKEQEVRCYLNHINKEDFQPRKELRTYQYLIDSLRQLKMFKRAVEFCNIALGKSITPKEKGIFLLEKSLCLNYISNMHSYEEKGDFENFYQILIQNLVISPNERNLNEMYIHLKNYLADCIYFPIAKGADFVVKIKEQKNVDVNHLIDELKRTYDLCLYGKVRKKVENQSERKIFKEFQTESSNIPYDPMKTKPIEMPKILTDSNVEGLNKETVQETHIEEKEKIDILKGGGYEFSFPATNERESDYDKVEKVKILNMNSLGKIKEQEHSYEELKNDYNKVSAMNIKLEEVNRELENENKLLKERLRELQNVKERLTNIYEDKMNIQREVIKSLQLQKGGNEAMSTTVSDRVVTMTNQEQKRHERDLNSRFKGEEMAELVLDDITEEMIINLAKIDGKIGVEEVQEMFMVGYRNAKDALQTMQMKGKLRESEEDVYIYVKD